jgi:DNA-binding PadR family transcriptional regulator
MSSASSPEEIKNWLKHGYWFVNGNNIRVALKRLRDKGLIERGESGFSITDKGMEYYESVKERILNGEMSPSEKQILEFLYAKELEWGHLVYPLQRLAEYLNMPLRRCLDACMRLACKEKIMLLLRRKEYWVSLSLTEFVKLKSEMAQV